MTKAKNIDSRRERVRLHIKEVSSRIRLAVSRSNLHITASLIDDKQGKTLATISDKAFKGTKTEKATLVGQAIAEQGKKLKIKQVVYDRGGFRYHGRIKALAEAARQAGLDF